MFENLFAIIELMIICGTVLTIALFVMLSLPDSQLRTFLMPIVWWGVAILCGVWCISPLDPIPDVLFPVGFADDAGALIAGISAARKAMSLVKEKKT